MQPPEVEVMAAPAPAPLAASAGGEATEEDTTEVHILRAPGQGLGISIAGGLGSTPYKGDDEVSVSLLA